MSDIASALTRLERAVDRLESAVAVREQQVRSRASMLEQQARSSQDALAALTAERDALLTREQAVRGRLDRVIGDLQTGKYLS